MRWPGDRGSSIPARIESQPPQVCISCFEVARLWLFHHWCLSFPLHLSSPTPCSSPPLSPASCAGVLQPTHRRRQGKKPSRRGSRGEKVKKVEASSSSDLVSHGWNILPGGYSRRVFHDVHFEDVEMYVLPPSVYPESLGALNLNT